MTVLLRPAELLYHAINRARRSLYRVGVLRRHELPRPVVSVGNIAMGGGGKTPMVIALANALTGRGLRVAVLSRGFGGTLSRKVGQILVPPFDPSRFGDEPVLIARRVPTADVVVGARRWESGLTYLVQKDCDVFLLDDGFQHLRLRRDLDIVLDQPAARWHREGRSALRDADIVLRRVESASEDGDRTARLEPSAVVRNGERHSVETLRGTRVYPFSGLADNAQFLRTVTGLGCEIAAWRSFADHFRYTSADIDAILCEAGRLGAEPLTSEKDAVKIDDPAVAILEVSMRIPSLDAIVERIVSLTRK